MKKTTLILAAIFISSLFTNKIIAGSGTESDPYTVPEAMEDQKGSASEPYEKWVKGYIVGAVKAGDKGTIEGNDDVVFGTTDIRATMILLAESSTISDVSQCIAVNLPTGAIRTALNLVDNPDNLGKEVNVNGNLRAYFSIAGIRELTDYSFGGEEPDNVIFSETFEASQGNFVIVDVTKPLEITDVWRHNSTYKQMAAGAYVDGTNYATESWLISPVVDLSNKTTAAFTFEHAGKQFGAPVTNLTIQVSTTYTEGEIIPADWNELTIPNHLEGETNTFKSAGEMDLTPYCGQNNVRIAFKYISTVSGAGNWYVKNVVVEGTGGNSGFETPMSDLPVMYISGNNLIVKNILEGTVVEFYNALGAKVQTSVFDGNSINLNNLSKGVYIIRAGKYAQKIMF